MEEENTSSSEEPQPLDTKDLARKLSSAAWGLFFIWVGIVMLAKLTAGTAMIGVGVITLLAQAARKRVRLKLEWLWVAVGVLFVAGGLWERLAVGFPLLPVLLIAAGAALLGSTFALGKGKSD